MLYLPDKRPLAALPPACLPVLAIGTASFVAAARSRPGLDLRLPPDEGRRSAERRTCPNVGDSRSEVNKKIHLVVDLSDQG
jgi:hypothetical protein